MLNGIKSELYKARKNKIFYVCSGIVVLAAIWLVYKDTVVSTPPDNSLSWIQSAAIITGIFLPIASGFIITFLFQREYEDKTIINVLCAPTSRITFIISKLVVWLLWYTVILGICFIIYLFGGYIIYSGSFGLNEVKLLLEMVVRTMILSFIAEIPLVFLAVMQRRTFYPTIMCSLGLTGLGLCATIIPLKYSTIIPWTAVMTSAFGLPREYLIRVLIVVGATGILGIVSAIMFFRKQNL